MRPTAYRHNARGLRDRQPFEGVRMKAGALFAAGHSQAEVARMLGVARQNVRQPLARPLASGRSRGVAQRRPRARRPRASVGALSHCGLVVSRRRAWKAPPRV